MNLVMWSAAFSESVTAMVTYPSTYVASSIKAHQTNALFLD
jgi:hypothetical protein